MGSVGNPIKRVANAGIRIEINKRVLSDGSVSYHGRFRKRGKEREYVGYISTTEIGKYKERFERYHARGQNGDGASPDKPV